MVGAIIMVKAAPGEAEALVERVLGQEFVTEVHVVAGDFDLVVEAEAPEVYDILHSVSTAIRGLAGVADTKSYVCLE